MRAAVWLCAIGLAGAAYAGGVSIDVTAPPAERLSAYGLFIDPARQIPNEGVIPYDLTTPLFSEYAAKHRFVWLPPGTAATYHARDAFEFPVGSVLIKTFGYLHDMRDPARGEKLVETRLFIHKPDGWAGFPYVWNEEGTDARLAIAGARVPVAWTDNQGKPQSLNYIVPNVNDCRQCHANEDKMQQIGPKARYLNNDFAYTSGKENQLAHWQAIGYLTGAPELKIAPRAPVWDDPGTGTVEERARAYLDINCAHCHSPGGSAYTSGLDLSFDQTTPARYGVEKTPVAAGRSAGVGHFAIEPGNPDTSILLYRMIVTDPGVRMPVTGRNLVHNEGVALIRQWIEQMR